MEDNNNQKWGKDVAQGLIGILIIIAFLVSGLLHKFPQALMLYCLFMIYAFYMQHKKNRRKFICYFLFMHLIILPLIVLFFSGILKPEKYPILSNISGFIIAIPVVWYAYKLIIHILNSGKS
tara:strand:- start:44 stop:409 length:366 start_codon:yes stop_codon:yes gene_type:complete